MVIQRAELESSGAYVAAFSLFGFLGVGIGLGRCGCQGGLFDEGRSEDKLELGHRVSRCLIWIMVGEGMNTLRSPSMCSIICCLSSYWTMPDWTRLSNLERMRDSSISGVNFLLVDCVKGRSIVYVVECGIDIPTPGGVPAYL